MAMEAPSGRVQIWLNARRPGWWVVPLTITMVIVFAGSGWSVRGPDDERLAIELAVVAANTLPLLAIRRNPMLVIAIFAVAYPTWVALDFPSHQLQSLPSIGKVPSRRVPGNSSKPVRSSPTGQWPTRGRGSLASCTTSSLTVVVGMGAGILAFTGIGLALGSLLPTARAAQGLGLLLFFGLFFIARVARPRPCSRRASIGSSKSRRWAW